MYLRARLATLREFYLRSLVTTCRSVWPGLERHDIQIFNKPRKTLQHDFPAPKFRAEALAKRTGKWLQVEAS